MSENNKDKEIEKKEMLLRNTKIANDLSLSMESTEQNMIGQSLRLSQTVHLYKEISDKTDKSQKLIGMLKKGLEIPFLSFPCTDA